MPIKRIIKTSDEITDLNFAGYIAVVNRLHYNRYNLEDHELQESKWFNTNILQYIPNEYIEHENTIASSISMSLMRDIWYISFMLKEAWTFENLKFTNPPILRAA